MGEICTAFGPFVPGIAYLLPEDIVASNVGRKTATLALGFQVQHFVDRGYKEAGFPFSLLEKETDPGDRIIGPEPFALRDTKAATYLKFDRKDLRGRIIPYVGQNRSNSHTVGRDELPAWKKRLSEDKDVIIDSWDYVDGTHSAVYFKGFLSFRKIVENNYLVLKDNGTAYFMLSSARLYCQAT
jgi:hypothetical protein